MSEEALKIRIRELEFALEYCAADYQYLLGITENKHNLHGWLRMRLVNTQSILNRKDGE